MLLSFQARHMLNAAQHHWLGDGIEKEEKTDTYPSKYGQVFQQQFKSVNLSAHLKEEQIQ